MSHSENDRSPRVNVTSKFRNDTRSLLKSRGVQAVLVLGAVAQGALIAGRDPAPKVGAPTGRAVMREAIQPIHVLPRKQVARLESLRMDSMAKETSETPRAVELAAKYREDGFKVSDRLASVIVEAAEENGISAEVAFGLVKTESGFKSTATSHVGAIGLTQLMPATARWLEPGTTRADLRDEETNLRIGFRYLKDLIKKYDGDTELALLAYNRGPGTVDRVLKRGGNPDNGYAAAVMGRRKGH